MRRLLVVEDEDAVAHVIATALRTAGYEVTVAPDGATALERALRAPPDLIILDLGPSDLDGLEVLRRLREAGERMPVIILSARAEPTDAVRGFEHGADDYLATPFAVEELLVRVRARLRPDARGAGDVLVYDDLRLDRRTRRASAPDVGEVELSAREYALLEQLMLHGGAILSREQLLDRVWGYGFDPGTNVVQVYVNYLRRKIGAHRITNVRGVGYRIDSGSRPPPAD